MDHFIDPMLAMRWSGYQLGSLSVATAVANGGIFLFPSQTAQPFRDKSIGRDQLSLQEGYHDDNKRSHVEVGMATEQEQRVVHHVVDKLT